MRRIFFLASLVTAAIGTQSFGQGGGGSSFGGGGGSGAGGGGSSFGGGSGGSSFGGSSGASGFAGGSGGGNSFTGGSSTSFTGGGGASFTGGGTSMSGGGGGGGRTTGGTGGSVAFTPSTTGIFAGYYTNPLYPGRPGSTNISNKTVGGFGQPTYGSTTTTTSRTTGTAGRTGGTATVGNRNGQTNANQFQQITPITYAMDLKFKAAPIVPARLQTDLQGLINRTSAIKTPGSVQVEVSGDTVILRGRVADDEERRVVEGMMRLEPGVHQVVNELKIP